MLLVDSQAHRTAHNVATCMLVCCLFIYSVHCLVCITYSHWSFPLNQKCREQTNAKVHAACSSPTKLRNTLCVGIYLVPSKYLGSPSNFALSMSQSFVGAIVFPQFLNLVAVASQSATSDYRHRKMVMTDVNASTNTNGSHHWSWRRSKLKHRSVPMHWLQSAGK